MAIFVNNKIAWRVRERSFSIQLVENISKNFLWEITKRDTFFSKISLCAHIRSPYFSYFLLIVTPLLLNKN